MLQNIIKELFMALEEEIDFALVYSRVRTKTQVVQYASNPPVICSSMSLFLLSARRLHTYVRL